MDDLSPLKFVAPKKTEINPDELNIVQAIQNGVFVRVKFLIEEEKCEPNLPDAQQIPLLHWAAINNRLQIAQFLIDCGAHVNRIGGIMKENAIHWATRQGHLGMIVLLIRHGGNYRELNKEAATPLHIAAQFQMTAICAYFIALGMDSDVKNDAGRTPLMVAITKRNVVDPCRILLTMGASAWTKDAEGNTPLHLAALQHNSCISSLLLGKGATVDVVNSAGSTPLQIAERNKDLCIVRNIQERMRRDKLTKMFTSKLPPLILTLYPLLGFGLIGYVLTCDLPYFLPIVYIAMVLLIQILLLKVFLSRSTGNPLPLGIYLGLITWLYCTMYFQLAPVYFDALSGLVFLVVAAVHVKSFLLVWRGDPGYLGLDYEKKLRDIVSLAESGSLDISRFCTSCAVRRPVRSKHCAVCDKCVARFDHHCPFVGNCIGMNNLKWFILYLITICVQLVFFFCAAYTYYRDVCYAEEDTWAGAIYVLVSCSPWLSYVSSLSSLVLFAVSCLTIMQLHQIVVMGVTTNELYNVARYNYMSNDCVGNSQISSPFTYGWKQNLSDFLELEIAGLPPPNRHDWTATYTWKPSVSIDTTLSDTPPPTPTKLKRSSSLSIIV